MFEVSWSLLWQSQCESQFQCYSLCQCIYKLQMRTLKKTYDDNQCKAAFHNPGYNLDITNGFLCWISSILQRSAYCYLFLTYYRDYRHSLCWFFKIWNETLIIILYLYCIVIWSLNLLLGISQQKYGNQHYSISPLLDYMILYMIFN